MTKPLHAYASGHSIDLLAGLYGCQLESLNRQQLFDFLYLLSAQIICSFDCGADEGEDTSAVKPFQLVEIACAESDDVALGLMQAIVSYLREPLETASAVKPQTPTVSIGGHEFEIDVATAQ